MEKTLASREVFAGRILHLRVDQVELDGGRVSSREIVEHPGAVAIVAFTQDRELVLVKQYRKAAERLTVEIPAGTLERGEEPLRCAVRELKEETGYSASTLRPVCSFYTAVGFCTEYMHMFVAEGLTAGEQATEDDEDIDVQTASVAEAMAMIRDGAIVDSKTIAGVLWAELYLGGHAQAMQLSQGRAG